MLQESGKFDPVIVRSEIRRAIETIEKDENNPVLLDNGVGKTAVVEDLLSVL